MYEKDRHVEVDARWRPGAARAFAESLFEATENRFGELSFWPPHPNDGKPPNGAFFTPLYHGVAGVAWGQLELASLGYGVLHNDYQTTIKHSRQDSAESLGKLISYDNKDDYVRGLLIADLGFMVPLIRVDPGATNISEAIDLIAGNLHNSVLEFLWGSPGSMLLLASLLETGRASPSHARLMVEGVEFLKEQLVESPSRKGRLWQQHLYNEEAYLLGAGHGFAGNAFAILRSFPYLSREEQEYWTHLIRATTVGTVETDGPYANWRQSIDLHRQGRTDWLVQYCHGAPGFVISLSTLMGEDSQFDDVMLAAGELTWKAGPLAKGSGFCHGTAGNGWAFLKLFEATRDQKWLDRAKAFAAWSITQAEREFTKQGDYRYSLWTGDHGVALFADACISHNFRAPTLERF